MRRLAWRIARSGLGWPGTAAILVAAVAVAGQALVVPSLQSRLDALAARGKARPGDATASAPDPHDALRRQFRDAPALPEQLGRLYRIAGENGLALRQGEYRLARDGDGRLRRYHASFPVAGSYPAVRRFIAQSLAELPTAALEHIAFERQRIGERGVEAEVRLTLFVER